MPIKVLVVDDNKMYREAVTRNLLFRGYDVTEAQNRADAHAKVQENLPEIIITDLDMGDRTAGIDLIREVKRDYPLMPVILVSAVGTFDEGALARQYGAMYVISKSKIDAEIENLYRLIDQSQVRVKEIVDLREQIAAAADEPEKIAPLRSKLESLLNDPELDAGMKGEVYELLTATEESARLTEVKAAQATVGQESDATQEAEKTLRTDIPGFDDLHPETRDMLLTAENMKVREGRGEAVAFSRNIGFSYSFAVENEIKERLGGKIRRFLGGNDMPKMIDYLFDKKMGNLDMFFSQHCILMQRQYNLDLNVDIIRQVIERIRVHQDRYKPDGLKALGVMVFTFGRNYEIKSIKGKLKVENPLGLKGLESEDSRMKFANSLVRLQHLRNPYIHPEFTEREKTDSIREAAIDCINYGVQLV